MKKCVDNRMESKEKRKKKKRERLGNKQKGEQICV